MDALGDIFDETPKKAQKEGGKARPRGLARSGL